ncbi:hypothetical protein RRG08_066362 [Elysia crispata]|uniref:Uncharacterized protein n=1 Tax=Elysia crispata TaxID=231223 RepID=A0AAE0YA58_9GAST|nr:hypothetical protein RRG08_066362 [Elysia crispata]
MDGDFTYSYVTELHLMTSIRHPEPVRRNAKMVGDFTYSYVTELHLMASIRHPESLIWKSVLCVLRLQEFLPGNLEPNVGIMIDDGDAMPGPRRKYSLALPVSVLVNHCRKFQVNPLANLYLR